MRLHHLTMTAFGPFAGCEQVDFDELCDAGLFLLTGPTGAGKTTILDAVCFALYGSVPGVRGVKALKSQHAGDDARPEVVLDFSVRERRFVVRRTPEWTRPKRRGSGFTTENATATLVEVSSGEDHLLSSRAQEVGHFIGELVGMQATQFVQVAMLPQGDFQKFLRASSHDRHAVLQHLFRTDRYARIEEWVHDHSRGLKQRSATRRQAVVRVLDTVADRVGGEVPASLAEDALQAPEAQDQAMSWVDALVEAAALAHAAAEDQHAAAAEHAAGARARHEEAVRLGEVHDRWERALATLAGLAEDAEAEQDARRRLEGDDRSSRCLPLLRMLDEAMVRSRSSQHDWSLAAARLDVLDLGDLRPPEPVTAEALADLEQRARSGAARLEALLPRERELADARAGLETGRDELVSVLSAHQAAGERAASLPALIEEHRTRAAAAAEAAGRAETVALELEQARERVAAAQEAERCVDSLPGLRDAERDARDRSADARQHMQDLTARRLAGIAAELAGQLRDGQACQVCGGVEHPSPAAPTGNPVTEAEQAAAAAAYDAASADHMTAAGKVLQAEQRLEGLRTAARGLATADASARVEELAEQLQGSERAQAELALLEARLVELSREEQELATTLNQLAIRIATLDQAAESHARTIEALSAELAAEIDLAVPLAGQMARLTGLATAFAEARESLCDRDAALARLEELQARTEAAAREHGFGDVDTLRAASLGAEERLRLEQLVDSRATAAARAAAVLDDDAVRALEGQVLPDIPASSAALQEAEMVESSAARGLHHCEESLQALRRQRTRLHDAFREWAPIREEYLRADSMSQLVRGMGSDNQLQMRLSAYVLATRLDQVVEAANERLAHMRDQRYLLQRTGRATRKGAQAGLGLEVVDQWTGDVREPATLSGGETFVVSLALALGLADVVTQEAGGTEIETLFVDEGFGTLDADTLDDVMDRLDDLRAGGRAVGVVSHVSEMRNRIPTQLHVEKRRNGSAVAVRTAVG